MAQGLPRKPRNFLADLARNPWGYGPEGMASPEEGVADPRALDRGQNALAMFGPFAEVAAPYLPEKGRAMADEAVAQAPYLALGPAGRVIQAAPKATAAAAGLLGLTALPSSAGEKPSPAVIKLQEQLRDAGFYKGPIDGLMKGQTAKAKEDFDKAEEKRLNLEIERKGKEAAIAETTRLGREAKTKELQREAGEARLKELDEEGPSFMQQYGPWIGAGLGAVVGGGGRAWLTRSFGEKSAEAARLANERISRGGEVPSRVGAVNRFWQEGGAKTVPFTAAPKAKSAVKSNRQAPSATTLYPPQSVLSQYVKGSDVAAAGLGVGEWAGAEHVASHYRGKLAEAERAVAQDPSEANIQRMRSAREETARWESIARFGLGVVSGTGIVGSKMRYKSARPDVDAAEGERLAIDRIINRRSRSRTPRAPKK